MGKSADTVMWLGLAFVVIGLPEWVDRLNYQGHLNLHWIERREADHDRSSPALSASLGAFLLEESAIIGGSELSLRGCDYLSTEDCPPDLAYMNDGLASKSLGLNQAFLGYRDTERERELFGLMGKFRLPQADTYSLLNPSVTPEGAYEAMVWKVSESGIEAQGFATQISLDQNLSSHSSTFRSWLFLQGLSMSVPFGMDSLLRGGAHLYYFHDLSDRIQNASAAKGNSFSGALDASPSLNHKFAPIETWVEISGTPLGIFTRLRTAGAVNIRTSDYQRAFVILGQLGRAKFDEGTRIELKISYFYIEPDVTVASFSNYQFGYANRNGALIDAVYLLSSNLRVFAGFAFSDTLASSGEQSTRTDWTGGLGAFF